MKAPPAKVIANRNGRLLAPKRASHMGGSHSPVNSLPCHAARNAPPIAPNTNMTSQSIFGFRAARAFEVRYRTLPELRRLFETRVGPAQFEADCFFGIGLQPTDAPLMTPALKAVTSASEILKRTSRRFPALTRVADSVFVDAAKTA